MDHRRFSQRLTPSTTASDVMSQTSSNAADRLHQITENAGSASSAGTNTAVASPAVSSGKPAVKTNAAVGLRLKRAALMAFFASLLLTFPVERLIPSRSLEITTASLVLSVAAAALYIASMVFRLRAIRAGGSA